MRIHSNVIVFIVCFLFTFVSAEAKRIVVHTIDDFQKVIVDSGTKYIVKEEIDLQGSHILLAPNSKLIFKKGCLKNGIIEGNSTRLKNNKDRMIFRDCEMRGTWDVNYAYSSMFNEDMETVLLLKNLSTISPNVRLSANREYHITARGESVLLNSLESEGKDKPLISFHTIDPNINGLNILGNNVTLKNLIVIDDYNPENDILYGKNNFTSGNTIGIGSPEKKVKTLLITGCDFMGSTSSSYIASSQTRSCLVNNCSFSGYMADHAVYCSMCAESFVVQNCSINDVSRTTGLFKIRTSSVLESFILNDIKVHNLNGYLARISLLETPTASIAFENITVSKDSDNISTFYGLCITDETESDKLEATSHYNVGEITISNSNFGYGYNGESLIYPGSEKKVRAKKIKYINVDAVQSNFGGGISDELIVDQCIFEECTDNQGILIASRSVLIDNSTLSRSDRYKGDNLFLINYSSITTNSFCLNNVSFNMNVGNLFKINKGGELYLTIDSCILPNLSGNLFFASRESVFQYKIYNTKSSEGHFKEKEIF